MKKTVLVVLFLFALQAILLPACADSAWTCPQCGQVNYGNFCSNCGAAKSSSASGSGGYIPVAPGYINANTYIRNIYDESLWLPDHAADLNDTTCWQFSIADNTLGSVCLDILFVQPSTVDEIWFKNGFWRNASGDDPYSINCRIKGVRVEFYNDYGNLLGTFRLTLQDDFSRRDWQRFSVTRLYSVMRMRIVPESIYTGSRFPKDVCLNEVMAVERTGSVQPAPAPSQDSGSGIPAGLKMRLSTRSGPSPLYDEPGSFFFSNWQTTTVRVLGKAWDNTNGIWWVLVDFENKGTKYRAWTGLKRVDVNIDRVPEIYASGSGTVYPTEAYYGPGGSYARCAGISQAQQVTLYGRENGYVEVEFYDSYAGLNRRCWVPASAVR